MEVPLPSYASTMLQFSAMPVNDLITHNGRRDLALPVNYMFFTCAV